MKEEALLYFSKGYSIFPLRPDKRPYINKWEPYQLEFASDEQIEKWWRKWKNANIAIVCGELSGIIVIDVDTKEAKESIEEFIPDSLVIPTTTTPNGGWHLYFKFKPGLSNKVNVLPGVDIRTEGGYSVAAPSSCKYEKGGKVIEGSHKWTNGTGVIYPNEMPEIPSMLFDTLEQACRSCSSSYVFNTNIANTNTIRSVGSANRNKPVTTITNHNISFEEPGRDDALFHLANYLVRGGMNEESIRIYLEFFAKNCIPSFPENEIKIKIKSALDRAEKREINFTQAIRDFISVTWGNISVTNAYQSVTNRNIPEEKAKVRTILARMAEKGILIRDPDRDGWYRKVDNDCKAEDWQNAETDTVELWLPFGLDRMAYIMPGDIILFAGAQNAGKSAILMNIAKENRHKYKISYFSSELRAGGFKRRMKNFTDVSIDQLNIDFYSRSSNWVDAIKKGKGNINIIDYIELHDNFYQISKILADIHDKLEGALLIAAIQKDPKAAYGRGGSFTQEKPVLSVSIDHGIATISKLKEWQEGLDNPNGKQYRFKLVGGCKLIRVDDWHSPLIK